MGRVSKVTPESLCKAYNTLRQEKGGQKLIGSQVEDLLSKEGISRWIVTKMLQNPTFFTKVKREGKGKCVGYIFQHDPVHISIFKNWLKDQKSVSKKEETKKTLTLEEECVQYLANQGYVLQKCVGFDEESFKKDYPQLYQKYLKYEKV